ncbi:iron uptake porin [Microcoleus sp. FACHB-1515]|uniref:iron uptake porin n=1 Tax=Cyanophyceae TaxID=3028117 RepID=UPI0018EF802A|nr:iron uptake porin [Microcoleus sp. FACHB-1515]
MNTQPVSTQARLFWRRSLFNSLFLALVLIAPPVLADDLVIELSDSPDAIEPSSTELNDLPQFIEPSPEIEPSATVLLERPVPTKAIEQPASSPAMSQVPSVSQLAEVQPTDIQPTRSNATAMAQVTSISQLSDVQPTDWAFQALQSLVERYGCIAGYPDGTYRGQRALTRFEFAAGLNACLDRINEIIQAGLADAITEEDLASVRRLQEEFAAELATLRGRVDALEARTAELEANQFSTTTVLRGQVWFNVTGAAATDDVQVETSNLGTPLNLRPAGRNSVTGRPIVSIVDGDDAEIVFNRYALLSLNTSFSGRDSLVTQLVFGSSNSPSNVFASAGLFNTFGTPFTDQTGTPTANVVSVRELFYSFPVGDDFQFVVGPRINWYRYFDQNAFTLFLTGASSFNASGSTLLNAIDRGSGLVIVWDINDQFDFAVGYLGENTEFLPDAFFNTSSNPSRGLFNGTNTITAQLTYSPSSRANLRFIYNRSTLAANVNIRNENGVITGQGVGGATGEPIYGVADDGFGGSIEDATADTFGFNFDWFITDNIGLFGRYTYGSTDIVPEDDDRDSGSINAQSLQAGISFLDFLTDGARLTLSYTTPFSVLDGRSFLAAGGGDGGVQYDFEATYYLPITNNIAIVPAIYFIGNPNNFSDNPNIWVGNLRTQFSF